MRHGAVVKGAAAVLAVVLSAAMQALAAADGGEFFYRDLMSAKPRQLVLGAEIAMLGHPPWKITKCPDSDAFNCIDSKEFKFAVPKRLAGRQEWSRNGAWYSVVADETYVFGSREERALLIEQTGQTNPVRFLYSLSRGLIALWLVEPNGSTKSFLILENPCGFAAPASCSEKVNQSPNAR